MGCECRLASPGPRCSCQKPEYLHLRQRPLPLQAFPSGVESLSWLAMCLTQCRLQRLRKGFAGECRARNDVHVCSLRLNSFRFEIGNRDLIDTLRCPAVLGVIQELYISDLSALDRSLHLHIAVERIGNVARVGAIPVKALGDC